MSDIILPNGSSHRPNPNHDAIIQRALSKSRSVQSANRPLEEIELAFFAMRNMQEKVHEIMTSVVKATPEGIVTPKNIDAIRDLMYKNFKESTVGLDKDTLACICSVMLTKVMENTL